MSTIVSIQDLSCLGKCSLTVTLPVVSAMGVAAPCCPRRCCPPTPHSPILTLRICLSTYCPPCAIGSR